jgi:hypothetical protein|tara:strand:- start:1208 stop:1843 length:636 start_codon:yes stop_codon:yes gene_type:complete
MGKKSLIQIFLIIILFIITSLIFNHFYISNNSLENSKNKEITEIEKNNGQVIDKNIIENVQYSLNNNKGDVYQVLADFGEINLDNPNLMFLTNVNASLLLANRTNIKLTSEFANFNTKTFETTFIKNIKVEREEETITGDELYLVLENEKEKTENTPLLDENLIRISNNILYKKPGYSLKADILEMDLISKDLKIFMLDKQKKVFAKTTIK